MLPNVDKDVTTLRHMWNNVYISPIDCAMMQCEFFCFLIAAYFLQSMCAAFKMSELAQSILVLVSSMGMFLTLCMEN